LVRSRRKRTFYVEGAVAILFTPQGEFVLPVDLADQKKSKNSNGNGNRSKGIREQSKNHINITTYLYYH
jgi:hypothetical protein